MRCVFPVRACTCRCTLLLGTVGSNVHACKHCVHAGGEQRLQQSSNAVPFPGRHLGQQQCLAPSGRFLDVEAAARDREPDARPILLFDLNGTLTSHTAQRRSCCWPAPPHAPACEPRSCPISAMCCTCLDQQSSPL